jgi:uncharacterized membrane protein
VKWNWFIGASILVAGLLIKFGAPISAVAAGIVLAWVATLKTHRSLKPRGPSRP